MWIYYSIFLFLLILFSDQGSKLWVAAHVQPLSSHSLLPGLFSITNVKNTGAAWSLLSGNQWLFIGIGAVAIFVAGYYLWKCRFDFWYETAVTLFVAGAFGNLFSRIVHGYVTDMIQTDFINFPIFNVADTSLTISVVLLMILVGFNRDLKKRD